MKRKGRVENKFLKRMKNDYTFRTFVFSSLSCFVTVAFAGYNAILAISYRSAWNIGIAVYYTIRCLAVSEFMSYFLSVNFIKQDLTSNEREGKEKNVFWYKAYCCSS